jgi:Tfp pilus assembly protein PilF
MDLRSDGNVKVARTPRQALLRDSVTFLVLTLVSIVLYGVTSLLFRSFEEHRKALALQWADHGRASLTASHPEDAVRALQVSLRYAPDSRDNQLLLAEALAASGHVDQAENYYLNLWETRPGDGFVNLQLARLDRRQGKSAQAIDSYHAAIFGSWPAHAVEQRRALRLELADYLVQLGNLPAARAELETVVSNAPNDPKLEAMLAQKLAAVGAESEAAQLYQKASAEDPSLAPMQQEAEAK